MRPIKKFLLSFALLLFCFIYGLGVGLYKWFPYAPLKFVQDSITISISSEPTNEESLLKISKNNEELLADLAKTNNIDLYESLDESKSLLSSKESNSMRFISYGDNPYIQEDRAEEVMKGLINSINNEKASLIFHVGDTKDNNSPCTNSSTNIQRNIMNSFNAPVLYTPGDNEWLDCSGSNKGEAHSSERLAHIRKTFFSNKRTLGRNPSVVENQIITGYPENARLSVGDVAFMTAHVVGGNNNFDPLSKQNTLEYFQRDAANIKWITESFERYKNASAYVVAIHANILYDSGAPLLQYSNFANALFELSNKYQKPVLLLNGDQHSFKAFQPNKEKYPFLHAVRNFGWPDLKAIEIEVNPSKNIPFNVIKIIGGRYNFTTTKVS